MNKVAIGRVVLTNREHIVALEPLEKGLVGTLLRYPYEVQSEEEYFDEIQDVKVTKDTLMARWPGSLPSPDGFLKTQSRAAQRRQAHREGTLAADRKTRKIVCPRPVRQLFSPCGI